MTYSLEILLGAEDSSCHNIIQFIPERIVRLIPTRFYSFFPHLRLFTFFTELVEVAIHVLCVTCDVGVKVCGALDSRLSVDPSTVVSLFTLFLQLPVETVCDEET